MKRNARATSGFTLIELLVVIAIIAILAAIQFPVFAKARAAAKASQCINNLRQVGMAMTSYGNDYDGRMPPTWRKYITRGETIGWENNVYTYIKSYGVFTCAELGYAHSYIRNEWAGEAMMDGRGNPAQTIHFFDVPRYNESGFTGAKFKGWNKAMKDSDDADWSNDEQYHYGDDDKTMILKTSFADQGLPYYLRFPGPHQDKSTICFLDGHVAAFRAWDGNKMTFRFGNQTKLIVHY